jgi:hypothetical protein
MEDEVSGEAPKVRANNPDEDGRSATTWHDRRAAFSPVPTGNSTLEGVVLER